MTPAHPSGRVGTPRGSRRSAPWWGASRGPVLTACLASLLAACGESEAPRAGDAAAYAEALAALEEAPAEAARLCAAIDRDELRADCVTAGVERLAATELAAARALCESLPDGAGRDECLFQAAEAGRDPGLCAAAGRFADDCRMHLWTATLQASLPRQTLPAEASELVPPLLEAHGFAPDDGRPWVAVYRMLLGARRPFDRSLCDAVSDEERRTICRDAGRDLYQDLLNNARDTGRFPCEGGPLPPMLAHTPDPELEALIARRRPVDLCPDG